MNSRTNEQALESIIEKALTGTCQEAIKAGAQDTALPSFENAAHAHQGYKVGHTKDYSARYAIDERYFWQFIMNTQEEEFNKVLRFSSNPEEAKFKILERFDRMCKTKGIINVLKKGLKVDNAEFHLMYPLPLASSSEAAKKNYKSNIFSITRQVRYSLANPLEEVDIVLFVNGIAFATIELKNAWTGQTARYHGIKQYCNDRDSNQTLFNFARSIVHMAVDTDEVYMTTKLAGKATFFLPFNKGNNGGKGNPPNPNGFKSAYLWEEVFARDSVANIIQHFVRLDGDEKDKLNKRTLFFPRYHQLDVVRKIINHAETNGVGHSYLIQHSAGSGKSNSITWAAYQLIEAYPQSQNISGSKGMDVPLFDSVIVVTDRRILDKQLKNTIKQFSQVKNIIAHAKRSSDLKEALEQGKKIIITTIQKFPYIVEGIEDMADRRFAVLIDEAHSSQSGIAHDKMNEVMGQSLDYDEDMDVQDKILQAMKARKVRDNASYLAFTATPKNTTLEKFGQHQPDGSFKPFHLYSMKQAIEEGFILDVLSNYTTFRSYYEINKSIEDNPKFNTVKAQKKLRSFVEGDKQPINTKAEVMLDHFIDKIISSKRLKGKAKGMVITQSIESAIHYYKALKGHLEKRGNPFKIAIAFSGTKTVDGIEYTESDINGFPDNKTEEYFDQDDYRLLVVANKYLTGFDQPKLCVMYVDKKLQGVLAVQALSRLNRSAPKLGKKTEDLFILDFFNSVDDIRLAFDDFYTSTSLSEATDVNVLHEIKDSLDEVGVYEWHEVEDFNTGFFNKKQGDEITQYIDFAVDRFDHHLELEHEDRVDFKIKAKQFVKIYGQMASILQYENIEWEKLYWFLKFLIPKLVVKDVESDLIDELLESVDLSTYGLERTNVGAKIGLSDDESVVDPQNPNPRGARGPEEPEDYLDNIVKDFNERWFSDWNATPEERRVKFLNLMTKIQEHPDYDTKFKNNSDEYNRDLAFEKIFQDVLLKSRRQEMELYKILQNDLAAKSALINSFRSVLDAR